MKASTVNRKRGLIKNIIILSILFIAASLVYTGSNYRPLTGTTIIIRYFIILLGALYFGIVYLNRYGFTRIPVPSFQSWHILLYWMIFSISVLISEIYNGEFPSNGLFFIWIVPLFLFLCFPRVIENLNYVLAVSSFISSFSYVFFSFVTVPFYSIPYSGLAANPNGFGQLGALSFIFGFILLFRYYKIKSYIHVIFIFLTLIISLLAVILSESRTSFMLVLLLSIIIFIFNFATEGISRKFILLPLIGFLIVYFVPIYDLFLNSIITKFRISMSHGDILNGRTYIWNTILNEATILGNGSDYWYKFGSEGAHNSILYIIGQFGIIAGILFFVFLLLSIYAAIKYAFAFKNVDPFSVVPLVSILSFCILSITEQMFGSIGKGVTLCFYISIGKIVYFNFGRGYIKEDC